MFKIAVGHCEDIDSFDVINKVLDQCKNILHETVPQAGLLFSAISYEHKTILNRIYEEFPNIELIGCTTDGEISCIHGFLEDSITLVLFASDEIEIKAGIGREISKNSMLSTSKALKEATEKCTKEKKLCIITPDGLTANVNNILDCIKITLGANFPIIGGTAGDQWEFKKTYQFYKNEVLTDSIPILLFAGPIIFSTGVASGWKPISQKAKITEAKDNILYKIDGKPALDYYRHYLGKIVETKFFGEYPLAIFEDKEDTFYLRAPFFTDKDAGSITYAANIPDNATVQISESTRDNIIKAAQESVTMAMNNYKGKNPDILLIFSCAARKQLLGTRTKEEYLAAKAMLPQNTSICGFYTYGEIGPIYEDSHSKFHNQTFITLIMGKHESE